MSKHDHELAPDLALITARLLREHLASIGKGQLTSELDAAIEAHESTAKPKGKGHG